MPGDRTVIRPSVPRYSINEVVYIRASAVKGFVEPVIVAGVRFEPAIGGYVYNTSREFNKEGRINARQTLPLVPLKETQIITLCEALTIQIGVLEKELKVMTSKLEMNCVEGLEHEASVIPFEIDGLVTPVAPRFGYNEVVYLKESADTIGRLEAFRVTDLEWESQFREWVYSFEITPRPGKNMTVGDRGDLTHSTVIKYLESNLCKLCEALPLAVSFLDRSVSRANFRLESICPDSSS